MTRLQFDNKISLGHLLTAAMMGLGGATAYADLRSSQRHLAAQVIAAERTGSLYRKNNTKTNVNTGWVAIT